MSLVVYTETPTRRGRTIMSRYQDTILTGLLAFAGGFLAGILLAPASGKRTRRRIAGEARSQVRHLEKQLDGVDRKIDELQRNVRKAGANLGERVVDAAKHVVESVPEDPDAFRVGKGDVDKDLRRMPRR